MSLLQNIHKIPWRFSIFRPGPEPWTKLPPAIPRFVWTKLHWQQLNALEIERESIVCCSCYQIYLNSFRFSFLHQSSSCKKIMLHSNIRSLAIDKHKPFPLAHQTKWEICELVMFEAKEKNPFKENKNSPRWGHYFVWRDQFYSHFLIDWCELQVIAMFFVFCFFEKGTDSYRS